MFFRVVCSEARDWHSLHQTKQLRTLNCLRLPRRSIAIAELCVYGAQSDNKTEPTNCRFESRDWRSLGQPKGIKTIEFWIVCVYRDIQYQSPMSFPNARHKGMTFRNCWRCFLKRKSAHEQDTEYNDLLPESKGQGLQSSCLMERRCLTVVLPNRLQVWGGKQQNQTRTCQWHLLSQSPMRWHCPKIFSLNRLQVWGGEQQNQPRTCQWHLLSQSPMRWHCPTISPWTECRFEGEIEEPQIHNDICWVNCLWNGVVQHYLPITDAGLRGRTSREQSFTCIPLPETSFEGENCTKSSEQRFETLTRCSHCT